MGSFWTKLCCCCCFRKKFEKTEYKRSKDLKKLESITPSKQSEIWSATTNPMDVKTEDMSDFYNIPNNKFRTEEDVIQWKGYKIDTFIDSGAFASVWKARHLTSNLEVAVKKVVIPHELDEKTAKKRQNLLKDIKNELFAMQNIRHRHIIRLINHFVVININDKQHTLYIVMQLAKGGNLSKMSDQFGPFSETSCKLWFAQLLSALNCVHSKGMAHRDLKLSNILLDEQKDILISDFGLSRLVWRKSTDDMLVSKTFCGTPPYMSPELLMQYKPDSETTVGYDAQAVDVWALGVILYKLFNREYPFPLNRRKAIKYMNKKLWDFSKNTVSPPSSGLKNILDDIFEPNPKRRPRIEKLIRHKWIRHTFQEIELKSIKMDNQTTEPLN